MTVLRWAWELVQVEAVEELALKVLVTQVPSEAVLQDG